MVKFSIQVEDLEKAKTFLYFVMEDYITVVVTEVGVYLTSDNPSLYMHYYFPLVTRFGLEETIVFRVSRKDLYGLLMEGLIEFVVDDLNVTLQFKSKTNEVYYTVDLKRQMAITDKFLAKMQIAEQARSYESFNIEQFSQLIRFSKTLNKPISCLDNMAYIEDKGVLLFRKVKAPNFGCSGKLLDLLLRYTTVVYNVQNYLVYIDSHIAIMVTKNREGADPGIAYTQQSEALYYVNLNMSRMLTLAKRLRFKDGELMLDINKNKVIYKTDTITYTTTLGVEEIKCKPKVKIENTSTNLDMDLDNLDLSLDDLTDEFNSAELNLLDSKDDNAISKFYIPCSILNKVLAHLPPNRIIKLRICRDFITLRSGSIYVVFGRRDVDEK